MKYPHFYQRSIRYSRHSDDRRIGSACRSRPGLSRCRRRLALTCSGSGDCRADEHDRVCLFWSRTQSSLRNPGESVLPLNASNSRWIIVRSGNFRLRWHGHGCYWHRYRWFGPNTGGPMRARRFQADRRAISTCGHTAVVDIPRLDWSTYPQRLMLPDPRRGLERSAL